MSAGLWFDSFATPVGRATSVVDDDGAVTCFHFGAMDTQGLRRDGRLTAAVRDQVQSYFAGDLRVFDLPLAPGGTAFQRRVWDGLLTIPFGQTLSYGELAARIWRAGASRAVGAANGANPIALIVPCHRVIGGDRSLTGYAGGVSLKAALLAHEGVLTPALAAGANARTRVVASSLLL